MTREPFEVPASATERDATHDQRVRAGLGRSQEQIAWDYLVSRGEQWINFTSFVGTLTPFGELSWTSPSAGAWLRRLLRDGKVERRAMRTTSVGRSSRGARVGHRTQYRIAQPPPAGAQEPATAPPGPF